MSTTKTIQTLLLSGVAAAALSAPASALEAQAFVDRVAEVYRTMGYELSFGEATLDDGGAGVVVRVRVESGERLARGDQAVIVGYDADKQEFTVAPMPDLLEDVRDEEPRRSSSNAR